VVNCIAVIRRFFSVKAAVGNLIIGSANLNAASAGAVAESQSKFHPDSEGPAQRATAGGRSPLLALEHRSNVGGLKELDPAFYGKGAAGTEASSEQAYPSDPNILARTAKMLDDAAVSGNGQVSRIRNYRSQTFRS